MSVINVASTAQLLSALKSVGAGDTIALAAGTYSGAYLRDINPSGSITITSADASNPAVFTDLVIRTSSNIVLSNVEMKAPDNGNVNPFQILSSQNVTVENVEVSGVVEGPKSEYNGLLIRGSEFISVKSSEFHDLEFGISVLDSNGIEISNNTMHDIRTDGVRAGGTSNAVIANNLFTDFYPAEGDHPDAIQFWTTNTTKSAENIVVTGNIIVRGDGDPVQGVFFRDQIGNLPFKNVTITNNLVIGGLYNGIYTDGVNGGVIQDNWVLAQPDQTSWIRTQKVTGVEISGNISTTYVTGSTAVPEGNTLVKAVEDGGAAALASWLASGQMAGTTDADASALLVELGAVDPSSQPSPGTAPSTALLVKTVSLEGTDGNDKLSADKQFFTTIKAGAGNDTLTGSSVGSNLYGGKGDDTYQVRSDKDLVIELAGEGNDTVVASVSYTLSQNVEILRLGSDAVDGTGNALDNRIVGNALSNTLAGGDGMDLIQGGAGNDALYGDAGNDDLRGDAGDDQIFGGEGNDKLSGADGADILQGGAGADVLEGGVGNDSLWGGAGKDIFRFRDECVTGKDKDQIFDFVVGEDRIDLGVIDARTGTSLNDAFALIGGAAFSGKAGELQVKTVAGGANVSGDVNGDGIADFSILVHGVATLTGGNFIL